MDISRSKTCLFRKVALRQWKAHLEKYLKKGSLLYVEGKIRTDRYTDADGQERQARKIRVGSFQMMGSMLSSRTEEGGNREQGTEVHTSETFHQEGPNSLDGGSDVQDEELPF